MMAPLTGAADAPVVAARPMLAAVKPATMIVRIAVSPLLEVRSPAPYALLEVSLRKPSCLHSVFSQPCFYRDTSIAE
jgi:hypothetical protein